MKTRSFFLTILFLLGTVSLFAQEVTKKFEVKGNCGMCEKRIETATKSVDGVTNADWDKDTKIMEVTFDASKTSEDAVQLAIANVGHDTPMHKADSEVYNDLPKCCQYPKDEHPHMDMQKEGKMEMDHDMNHDMKHDMNNKPKQEVQ
jgi:copper chaperone CopZ